MSVFGIDIGWIVVGLLMVAWIVAWLVDIVAVSEAPTWDEVRNIRMPNKIAYATGTILIFVSFFIFFGIFNAKTETTYEDGWEYSETHELASLVAFDGDGRMTVGSASAWGIFGIGRGEGSVSSPSDAGVYLLVEQTADGGLHKLAIDADQAVIYESESYDTAYRAEHYKQVEYETKTLIEPSWWFPSQNEKYADGPVRTSRDKSSENDEWIIYVPTGSITTGTWDAGMGMDGETVKKGE